MVQDALLMAATPWTNMLVRQRVGAFAFQSGPGRHWTLEGAAPAPPEVAAGPTSTGRGGVALTRRRPPVHRGS